ncbi:hypothetical protein BASA61_003811 [Batrachochytrium salamandrivorans]|nr:hypothetical protein BASA61_003811 [Batrachochytrium salamandrivorans]
MKFNALVVAAMVIASVNAVWYEGLLSETGNGDGRSTTVVAEGSSGNGQGKVQYSGPTEKDPKCADLETRLGDLWGKSASLESEFQDQLPDYSSLMNGIGKSGRKIKPHRLGTKQKAGYSELSDEEKAILDNFKAEYGAVMEEYEKVRRELIQECLAESFAMISREEVMRKGHFLQLPDEDGQTPSPYLGSIVAPVVSATVLRCALHRMVHPHSRLCGQLQLKRLLLWNLPICVSIQHRSCMHLLLLLGPVRSSSCIQVNLPCCHACLEVSVAAPMYSQRSALQTDTTMWLDLPISIPALSARSCLLPHRHRGNTSAVTHCDHISLPSKLSHRINPDRSPAEFTNRQRPTLCRSYRSGKHILHSTSSHIHIPTIRTSNAAIRHLNIPYILREYSSDHSWLLSAKYHSKSSVSSDLSPSLPPKPHPAPSSAVLAFEGLLGPLRSHQSPILVQAHEEGADTSSIPLKEVLDSTADLEYILQIISTTVMPDISHLNSLAYTLIERRQHSKLLQTHWGCICDHIMHYVIPQQQLSIHHVVATMERLLTTTSGIPIHTTTRSCHIPSQEDTTTHFYDSGIDDTFNSGFAALIELLLQRSDTPLALIMHVLRIALIKRGLHPQQSLAMPLRKYLLARLGVYTNDSAALRRLSRQGVFLVDDAAARRVFGVDAADDPSRVYDIIVYGFIMVHDLDSAVILLNCMVSNLAYPPCSAWIVNRLMRTLLWGRCLHTAIAVFYAYFQSRPLVGINVEEWLGIPPDLVGPTARIAGLSVQPCKAMAHRRLAVTPGTLGVIVGGLAINSYASVALQVLDSRAVKLLGITADITNYTSIIHGALTGIPRAMETAAECLRRIGLTHDGGSFLSLVDLFRSGVVVRPDLRAMTVIFDAAMRGKNNQVAQQIIHMVLQSGMRIDARFLESVGKWYLLQGNIDAFISVLREHCQDRQTYLGVVKGMLRMHVADQSRFYRHHPTMGASKNNGIVHGPLGMLVYPLLQFLTTDAGMDLLKSGVADSNFLVALFGTIVNHCVRHNCLADAERWAQMISAKHHVDFGRRGLLILVRAYLQRGPSQDVDRALDWFGVMIGWSFRHRKMRVGRYVLVDMDPDRCDDRVGLVGGSCEGETHTGDRDGLLVLPHYQASTADVRVVLASFISSVTRQPRIVVDIVQALAKVDATRNSTTTWYTDDCGVVQVAEIAHVCLFLRRCGLRDEAAQILASFEPDISKSCFSSLSFQVATREKYTLPDTCRQLFGAALPASMDWSSQNVVALALAPGDTVGFDRHGSSYTNTRPSGHEIVLWIPTGYVVQTPSETSVQYSGGVGLTVCADIRAVHGLNPVQILKWDTLGSHLASVDATGAIGIWNHHKSSCILESALDVHVQAPVIAFAWCEMQSRCQPTYSAKADTDGANLQRFESTAEFTYSSVIGPTPGFGAFAFVALTKSLELNMWCYGSDKVLVRHKLQIGGLGMSSGCSNACIIPISDNRMRTFVQTSTPGDLYMADISVDLFNGTFFLHDVSLVHIDPHAMIIQLHVVDQGRLAVVCEKKPPGGTMEHVLTIWETPATDSGNASGDSSSQWRMRSKWTFSDVLVTSLNHFLSFSNTADDVLAVGTSTGKIQFRSLQNLELVPDRHKLLFRDIILSPGSSSQSNATLSVSLDGTAEASSISMIQTSLDSVFNDMGPSIVPTVGLDGSNSQSDMSADFTDINLGLVVGLDEIFGMVSGVTPDPNILIEQPSSQTDKPILESVGYRVNLFSSPNGLHLLECRLSTALGKTNMSINASMLVEGAVDIRCAQQSIIPGKTAAESLVAPIAYAIADAMFAAILDGRCCSDFLVLIRSLAHNDWAKGTLLCTPLLQRLHLVHSNYFGAVVPLAASYPLQMLACRTVSEVLIGIQLAIQTIFIPRGPEFKNTRAQMRLRMIISMFQAASASTSSSDEALEALYLDAANYTASSTRSTHHMLHKESLHHLIPHALWVLEYCAFLVRVLYIRSGAVKTSAVGSNLINQEVKEFTQIMPFMHQATRRSLIMCIYYIKALRYNVSQSLVGINFPKSRPNLRSNFLLGYVRSVDNLLTVGRISIDAFATFLIEFDQIAENESMQLLHPSTPADHIDMFLGTSIPLSYGPQLTTQLQTLFSGHMTSFFNWPSGVSFPAQLSGATDAATAGADGTVSAASNEHGSPLMMFLPGQFDRLELDPIEYEAIVSKRPATMQFCTTTHRSNSHRRETTNEKEFVSVTHFDAVSGQHLRFSLAVRQCLVCCQFSAVDPLSPRALASLMDGSKNTTCVSLIETLSKGPVWAGYFSGCCTCGGRWRNVPS